MIVNNWQVTEGCTLGTAELVSGPVFLYTLNKPWSSLTMASKSYTSGPPPKYLNDFSKALAAEVRMLLSEVGKLREERRALQFEISELMCLKAKHGPGGVFEPTYPIPDNKAAAAPAAPPPAPTPTPPPPPAPAAWHRVHGKAERPRRAKKGKEEAPAAPAAPAPAPPPASWITWQPNPMLPQQAPPTAPSTTASARVPGLFGPRSPSRKDGDLP